MLCGLNVTCTDIIFCIYHVLYIMCINWGVNCIDHYGCILRNTMELMIRWREQKPQKPTQDMSRQMQSDTFSRTANFSYKCVQSSSEIEVNDICCWCYYELAAELFASVMMEKKTSHSPLLLVLSLHTVITQTSTSCPNTFRVHDFNAFRFSLFWILRFLGLEFSY